MATDKEFMDFIVDQVGNAGCISYRKMFGEYVLYCDGKAVALVCDNLLYVKPTKGGRAFIGNVVEASAYPGAKMSFSLRIKSMTVYARIPTSQSLYVPMSALTASASFYSLARGIACFSPMWA